MQQKAWFVYFAEPLGKKNQKVWSDKNGKRSQNIRTYSAPWRIDKMKNHNKSMHTIKWDKYQNWSKAEKKTLKRSLTSCQKERLSWL